MKGIWTKRVELGEDLAKNLNVVLHSEIIYFFQNVPMLTRCPCDKALLSFGNKKKQFPITSHKGMWQSFPCELYTFRF